MRRISAVLATIFIVLSLFAVSCAKEERIPESATVTAADETTPQDGGTLVRRLQGEIVNLNPVLSDSKYDREVDSCLFTPLVNLDANLRPMPGLATSWEISPDGLRYTFHLDPKATFEDQTPVLASDLIYTMKKIVDPQSEAPEMSGFFEQIDLANSSVVDPHTAVVAFKKASAALIVHFNYVMVIPEHVYSKGDFKSDFASRVVGNGPYRLVRRIPGKEVLVERREDYWGKKPYIRFVLWKVISDDATAWKAMKLGEIDETPITSDVWLNESNRPELQKTIDFRRFYTLNYNFIAWNGRDPLLADKRVRRALAMCVDLKSIINNLYHGTARAMNGPFTPDEWSYNPAVPVIQYDPEGAKRILGSIGWLDTNGDGILDKDGKPFKFSMAVIGGNSASNPFAQLLQSELKKIGVEMEITPLESGSFIQRVLAGNYQSAYLAWDLDPDPDSNYTILHSSQIPPHGQNFVYYPSPVADQLLEAGRHELDYSKRVKIYQQLHQVLADDQPYTWTLQVSVKWAINKRLRNVNVSKGYGLDLWYPGQFDWWIPRNLRTHDVKGH